MTEPFGAEARPPAPAPRGRHRLLSILALVAGVAILSGVVAAGVTIGLLRQSRSASQDLNLAGIVPFSDESTITAVAQRSLPAMASVLAEGQGDAAVGSAFAVRGDGYLVTTVRVLANSAGLSVILARDNRRHDARVVDFDCGTGAAVLKVDQVSGLQALSWGDSGSLRAGQTVLATGGPLQPANSLSRGVVSSLHRTLTLPDAVDPGRDDQYPDVIGTDARIEDANSGGALLNTGGQVVGILVGPRGGNRAAFALSAGSVQAAVDQIIGSGQLVVPSLGTGGVEIGPEEASARGVVQGNLLRTVDALGPAAAAGLRPGDVITQIDDARVEPAHPVAQLLRSRFKPNQRVGVTFARGGTTTQVQLTLRAEHPNCT